MFPIASLRSSRLFAPLALGLSAGLAPAAAQLGSVTELFEPCPGGTGNLVSTSCRFLRVEVPGLPDVNVELRIVEPEPSVPLLGTAVFGSGGAGTEFYADLPGGELMVELATQAGFRAVDRRWKPGWFTSPEESIKAQSARYATLLAWIETEVHEGGLLAACGNSGGAGEIGYALTTWGMESLLDVVVLSSGPPMTRLDYLCEEPTPTWAALCPTLVPSGVLACGSVNCGPEPSNPLCPLLPENVPASVLVEDSLLHSAADLDYPETRVYGLFGRKDCSNAVPLGMLFLNSITSAKVVAYADTPHEFMSTKPGRAALLASLSCGAVVHAAAVYCTAGTSASGCQASVFAAGQPSASAPAGFSLGADGVEGQKDAMFFFGVNGSQAAPWGNGTSLQCVTPPVVRTGLLPGTGTAGACDGAFTQDLNALWCPSCSAPQLNPGPGVLIQAQLWYRDPLNTSNQTTSLSNAIEFCLGP